MTRAAITCLFGVYALARRVSPVVPFLVLALDAWWSMRKRLCRRDMRLCDGVFLLSCPVAAATLAFELAILCLAGRIPLRFQVQAFLVLSVASAVCLGFLVDLVRFAVRRPHNPAVAMVVLMALLAYVVPHLHAAANDRLSNVNAFIWGLCGWRVEQHLAEKPVRDEDTEWDV